jgi:hypothetical protein
MAALSEDAVSKLYNFPAYQRIQTLNSHVT